MKVRISREEILKTMKVPVNGADGAIVVLPDFLELEATPVEESSPWILCSSAANHDKAQKMGIECDCFKLKPLTRKYKFRYPVSAFDLNSELDQIYQALNELRKK